MNSFLSTRTNIVNDAIDGAIAASGGSIGRFSIDNSARVVARRDHDKSKVAVISGGGSGHEPSHAGFVGEGMLTAAVCGEIFASPSIDAVLSAIIAVTGEAGCLLVVKNYTGDRLNFGLAAEKAKALGYKVEMVIVSDDIAIPNASQPRGVAGTLFVHKIAGFMSERGDDLASIYEETSRVASRLYTIGVARDTCRIPGSEKQERLEEGQVEIGLGIHGEPGVEISDFASSDALVSELSDRLLNAIPDGDHKFVLMFNNLGGLSVIESSVLFSTIIKSKLMERVEFLIGPSAMMTALDMPGFSLTLFELDPFAVEALKAKASPSAWPGMVDKCPMDYIDAPEVPNVNRFKPSENPKVREILTKVARTCVSLEDEINDLDAKVGDGDTGSTFAIAGNLILEKLDDLPLADGEKLLRCLSRITSQGVGGSSGVLFGILFAGASEKYSTTKNWVKSLSHGLSLMQKYGGARLGDRTMIDALKPALEALEAGEPLSVAADAAGKGAAATAKMEKAGAGRSSYLSSRSLTGVSDPGAAAIALIFNSLA